jgi:hypothetical protein
MKGRWVCLPIDAITSILADYAGQVGFPPDAKPVKWYLNKQERKLMLIVEAESLPAGDNGKVETIKFNLKRVWGAN